MRTRTLQRSLQFERIWRSLGLDRVSNEPDILRLGRLFEGDVLQIFDARTGEELLARESIKKGSGRGHWLKARAVKGKTSNATWRKGKWVHPASRRRGRVGFIDLIIEFQDPGCELPARAAIEIKNTDWDQRAPHRVRPNLGIHRRQLWSYLEPMTEQVDRGGLAYVQGFLLYPRRPSTAGRAELLEAALADYGISIVWFDEL